ncbi:hypothetical protein [Roseibium algae]|uniref:Helix-turn-helix protein n=1 Tax=Roseibium algae TaxID=3123038 RepID=A0ABU8TJX5_9HYPH
MSAYLLGVGFKADMGTCARKLLLLKMIDACEDDGTRIYPAVSTLARAAQVSSRTVQREIKLFLDTGLIRQVREGGKGRRSTNEYAMNLDALWEIAKVGWDAYVGAVAEVASDENAGSDADVKGDRVSPLTADPKGDMGDALRVTNGCVKGDTRCHPTPPLDPSLYPSIERACERADAGAPVGATGEAGVAVSEAENDTASGTPSSTQSETGPTRKTWLARLRRAHATWPSHATDSRETTEKAWFDLSEAERHAATVGIKPYLELNRKLGRKLIVGFPRYLKEKCWEKLEPVAGDCGQKREVSAPFGKLWGAARMVDLLREPYGHIPPAKGFLKTFLEAGGPKAEREKLRRQSEYGWPEVNRMHADANRWRGALVPAHLEPLADCFEQVRVGSELWNAWADLHEARGWPWLGDCRPREWVWMPAGADVAGAVDEFVRAVERLDMGQKDAAE